MAIILADNLKTHTTEGPLLVQSMLAELSERLSLVYTPAYAPCCQLHRVEVRASHAESSRTLIIAETRESLLGFSQNAR